MNAFIDHVASGQAFFSGIAMILAALIVRGRGGRRGRRAGVVLALAGLIFVAVSSTPVPFRLDLAAGAITIAWLAAEGATRWATPSVRFWLRRAVVASWAILAACEAPYHVSPRLPRSAASRLDVIGDSLAAGLGHEAETWTGLLARRLGVPVRNLAKVVSARSQADRAIDAESVVLVEIGGNDVLGAIGPETFEAGLDGLLARLRAGRRTVVMLELPLPPFHAVYGAIQRRLARRHGVHLVPKRVLLSAMIGPDATVDSLHLAPSGHARLAEALAKILRPAFARR